VTYLEFNRDRIKNTPPVGVMFNPISQKWRVRATSNALRRLSFGEYHTLNEAIAIVKRMVKAQTCAAAFRLRDDLGIKGRGRFARLQKSSLARDKVRLAKKQKPL
jgi:hypothetical protein